MRSNVFTERPYDRKDSAIFGSFLIFQLKSFWIKRLFRWWLFKFTHSASCILYFGARDEMGLGLYTSNMAGPRPERKTIIIESGESWAFGVFPQHLSGTITIFAVTTLISSSEINAKIRQQSNKRNIPYISDVLSREVLKQKNLPSFLVSSEYPFPPPRSHSDAHGPSDPIKYPTYAFILHPPFPIATVIIRDFPVSISSCAQSIPLPPRRSRNSPLPSTRPPLQIAPHAQPPCHLELSPCPRIFQ